MRWWPGSAEGSAAAACPALIVALTTPFAADGHPDLGSLRAHVRWLAEQDVDSFMACGSAGEGPVLDDDEVCAVVSTVVDGAGGRPVLAHVGRAGALPTARLALRVVADAGVDAVSAVTPYFYAADDEQVVRHFAAVLDALGDATPLLAYAVPERAGTDLSVEAAHRLVDLGLGGIKDTTRSIERLAGYLTAGVPVFTGADLLVTRSVALGAAGSISATANIRPDLMRAALCGRPGATEELLALGAPMGRPELKREIAVLVDGYPSGCRSPMAPGVIAHAPVGRG
jgi:4-hydroxy-tetrahydrodipicolinate synthase